MCVTGAADASEVANGQNYNKDEQSTKVGVTIAARRDQLMIMKRSLSDSDSEESDSSAKKSKSDDDSVPSTHEYLELVLSRIVDLQRQIDEGVYASDETSDLGSDLEESDSDDEDVMQEVLTKVFKDLPGTPDSLSAIIDSTSKAPKAQMEAIRSKSIQLSGFETCKKVAVNFIENIAQLTPLDLSHDAMQEMKEVSLTELEARKRVLGSQLDMHLAVKQSDYTARLMRE
ncbi:hypothetical protein QAD02_023174 [Eretmocerus hayati]|uniref:Uncharacterized protein n=1 Tax=Eretmocerus hayati TaxID=131215 RepID=A0ACC2PVC3_9HYME|nr:hypothetical protein QAD02_023174 [Eretmocerus hayati]